MKHRHIALALALLAAFASDSRGQSQKPSPQGKESAQPAGPEQRGADSVPLAVKILPATDAKEQAEKAEHERKEKAVIDERLAFETRRIADYTDRLALFTVLLFSVAVLQAALFLWQLRYMGQGIRDAKAAALAAGRAAKATEDAVELSRATAQQQLRPYVLVDTSDIRMMDNNTLRSFIHLKNFGQTPAYDVKSWVDMRVDKPGNPPFAQKLPFGFNTVMGPGAEFIIGPDPISMSAEVPQQIKIGTRIIYVWGEVSYRDTFGKRWIFHFYVRNSEMMFNIDDASGGTVPGWAFSPYPDFGYQEHEAENQA